MSTEETKALIQRMINSLNDHVIDGQEEFWKEDMIWRGPAGIDTKDSLKRFQDEHQRPFLHAFPDKFAVEEIHFAQGEYAASVGHQEATHTGDWLGIPASGKKVKVRYMDVWRVEGDKLAENWVMIDILDFIAQLGYDIVKVLKYIGSKSPEYFDEQVEG